MNDKKPFTIELEEATPMPHPAEVEQISDVAPLTKFRCRQGADWDYLVGPYRLGFLWCLRISQLGFGISFWLSSRAISSLVGSWAGLRPRLLRSFLP